MRRKQVKRRMKNKQNTSGIFMILLHALSSVIFFAAVVLLDMLPGKYLAMVALILLCLWLVTVLLQVARKKGTAGKIYGILLCAVLLTGAFYSMRINGTIAKITDNGQNGDTVGEDDTLVTRSFTVYISGIDMYNDDGGENGGGRSDVNIIAVVNPTTYQILLVTTPRDYYVEIPGVSEGMGDKLTHAGLYGVDASMRTLAQLYETEIDYYARINFSAMIEIVDALGGIDVESEYAFTTSEDSGLVMDVQEGTNHFNGEQALAFSRERQNLDDGDNQRGKNQQAVITAMIRKMLSPTMLLRANAVLSSVSQNVETNISQDQINTLIKYQLRNEISWKIKSVAASGEPGEDYCYSTGDQLLYVTWPDYDVVNEIIGEVNMIEEGGILEDAETLN